jgi:hypothetical protein
MMCTPHAMMILTILLYAIVLPSSDYFAVKAQLKVAVDHIGLPILLHAVLKAMLAFPILLY